MKKEIVKTQDTDTNVVAWLDLQHRTMKLREAKTDPKVVRERTLYIDKKTGIEKTVDYIRRKTALQWLDENYPGWSMEVHYDEAKEYGGSYGCPVTITVFEPNGLLRKIKCVGSMAVRFDRKTGEPITDVPYIKGCESDAIKRCVVTLGGFNDIYEEEEAEDYKVDKEDAIWFIMNAVPNLYNAIRMEQYTPLKLYKLFLQFYLGNIKVDEVKQLLGSFIYE